MPKSRRFTPLAAIAAVAVATIIAAPAARAQSSDALIDKLVEKGILTVREANELRAESDRNFTTAHALKTGMPDWVDSLKLSGDVRIRYESFSFDHPGAADRNRFLYRARLGFVAAIHDSLEAGLRLTSGDPIGNFGGHPLSGNTTFGDNASRKSVYLDLAYAKWSPLNNADWSGALTAGKMENPFRFPSTMMFDTDYTPEGGAIELTRRLNPEHALHLTAGGFVLDEISADSNDPYMAAAQLRWDAVWGRRWNSAAGVSTWWLANRHNLGAADPLPNAGFGNTRTAAGELVHAYRPVQVDVSVTHTLESFPFYSGPCPLTVFVEAIHNPEVSDRNDGYAFGVTLGRAGRRGLWDLSWQYRKIEGDAWFEDVSESDFGAFYVASPVGGGAGYRGGTNVRGHILRGRYSPTDALTLAVSLWLTELIEEFPDGSNSGTSRLQVDASLRF